MVPEFWRSSALASLEARRSAQENSCYRQHAHDALSVGVIDAGVSIFAGPITGGVRLEPGDVVIIPAGQVHACNPEHGRWLYRMIHLDQGWATSLMSPEASAGLLDGVSVLRDSALGEAAGRLTDVLFLDSAPEADRGRIYPLLRLGRSRPGRRPCPSTSRSRAARQDRARAATTA